MSEKEQFTLGSDKAILETDSLSAYAQGLNRATDEQVQAYDAEQAALANTSDLEALAVGAASGLTVGLSDIALSQTEYSDNLQQLRQFRGNNFLAGQLAGGTVGAFASGGLGAVQRGLAAPGHALGRALQGTVGKRAAGALAGATEGAIFGATANIGDQLSSGQVFSAEQLWNTVGLGAGLGGGLGALMNLPVGSAATAGVRNAVRRLADGDPAAVQHLSKFSKVHRTTGSLQDDAGEAAYKRLLGGDDGLMSNYRKAREASDVTQKIAEKNQDVLPSFVRQAREAEGKFLTEITKAGKIADNLTEEQASIAIATVNQRLSGLRALVDSDLVPLDPMARQAFDEAIDARIARSAKIEDPRRRAAQLFEDLGDLQKDIPSLKKSFLEDLGPARQDLTPQETRFWGQVERTLKDTRSSSDLWGPSAFLLEEGQRLLADKATKRRLLERYFIDSAGNAKPSVKQFFKGMGDQAGREQTHHKFRVFQDYLASEEAFADFIQKAGLDEITDVAASKTTIKNLRDDLEIAEDYLGHLSDLNRIRKQEHESVGFGMSGLFGALGGAINVPLGFAISTAGSMARSPTNTLSTIFQVTEALGKRSAKWDNSLPKLAGKALKDRTRNFRDRKVGALVGKVEAIRNAKDFNEKYQALEETIQKPEKTKLEMFSRVGNNESLLPAIQEANQVGMQAMTYVLQQAPNAALNKPASPTEKSRFNAALQGVSDPYGMLARLEKGNLDFREARAIKNSYPQEYELMREKALEFVVDLEAQGKRLTRRQKTQLSLAFDLKLEPRLNLQYQEIMVQGYNTVGEEDNSQVPELHNTYENTSEVVSRNNQDAR